MSQKFIGLDDAAEQLGVSKERLNELREAGDLRAYRDGASWKFRTEEIEKLAAEGLPTGGDDDLELGELELDLGDIASPEAAADDGDLDLGIEPLGEGDDAESILLTEGELEGGLPRPPSTIIGRGESSDDDDLSLAPASLAGESPSPSFDEVDELELDLEAESSRILDGKDVAAAQAAAKEASATDDDELELDLGSAAPVIGGSDPANASDPSVTGELPKPGSVAGLSGLDQVELGADEDDDVVLGGSDDLSLSGSDSGINLAPSDSGIALDEVPLDLGGSAIGSALDLAALSAASGVGGGSDAKDDDGGLASGEDFLLTPTSEGEGEEEDSSQVVAFEDIAEEEDVVAFTPDEEGEEEEEFGFGGESSIGGDLGGAAIGAGPVGAQAAVAPAAAEATFPLWIMLLMGSSLFTMTLCGMVALDLVQSIWSWDEPYAVNSAIIDGILGIFGG